MTRRLFAVLAALVLAFSLSPPASADTYEFKFERMGFRTTDAAATTQEVNWASKYPSFNDGFADSTVFRKGAATNALVDTSQAYILSDFLYPPTYPSRGGQYGGRAARLSGMQALPGGTDSIIVDTTDSAPWITFVFHQDSTTTGPTQFVGTTGFDSVYIAAQWSYDGKTWINAQGTPTRAFLATTIVTAGDGTQPPALTVVEPNPGADYAFLSLEYQPQLAKSGAAFILNRTLCAAPTYVRFLVGVCDGSGQFAVEIGSWRRIKG